MSVTPRVVEGSLVVPKGARFAIVASRFNHFIVDRLVDGALDALARHGADDDAVTLVRVPGAWEIPYAVHRLAKAASTAAPAGGATRRAARGASERPRAALDAIIAIATVIRGSTPHFDYVAGEVSKGVAQASLSTGVPVSFGVLTTDTIEQAVERAGTKAGNKGWDAAVSAIEMVSLARALDGAGL
jgi:6,7-dimethyl-8-ribityllumazine synthase